MATTDLERAEQRKALDEFANTSAQPNQPTPGGHALVRPTQGLAERVIGAQPVAVHRDEQKILQKLSMLAAAAGTDWFYRFPVKKKDGGQDWIEGPSIKLANDVARIFGNDVIEVREIDVGDAWVFYSRFTDIETGFSMERAYRQRKTQASLKTKDADRQLDIAYQIGQSKSIRNVICNALQIYSDYAFEEARGSLVEKIGKDLPAWRTRTVEGLKRIPVELHNVERVVGRAAQNWLAADVASVIAMMKSIADGMATAEETFPAPDKQQESATSRDATEGSSAPAGAGPSQSASASATTIESAAAQDSPAADEGGGAVVGSPAAPSLDNFAEQVREAVDPIEVARRRGRQGFRDGKKRRECPEEYRQPGRGGEALEWTAGWDLEQAEAQKGQGNKRT